MFVEKLNQNQILMFLKSCEGYNKVCSVNIIKEATLDGLVLFSIEFSNRPRRIVSKIITATDTNIFFKKNEDWMKYLYSIFGEEYKTWYKEKLENEFKRLFS